MYSSRESIPDFDNSPKAAIVHAILQRAASFLPALNLKEAAAAAIVRVGLRPDSKTSLPLVTDRLNSVLAKENLTVQLFYITLRPS
jgi:hypothetical protein